MSVFINESNNTISMTRGDTLRTSVTIYNGDETYTPQAGDVINFYLKRALMTPGNKQFVDETPLITKTVSNNDMLLEILPEDTKSLDFGNYKYDLEITMNDGTVVTFIADVPFILTPEVG